MDTLSSNITFYAGVRYLTYRTGKRLHTLMKRLLILMTNDVPRDQNILFYIFTEKKLKR